MKQMTSLRAVAAAILVTAGSIGALASPASSQTPAEVTAKKAKIRPHTNQMTCTLLLPFICDPASRGNDAVVHVVVPHHFRSVTEVCVTLHFQGDLVDPGETVMLINGGGFENGGTTSLAERASCRNVQDQPEDTRLFEDGHQMMSVWMEQGSAYLASVDVVVTGVLR
jgi:hypothetical protein